MFFEKDRLIMTTQQPDMTYADSGVGYDDLDAFKRAAMAAARDTTDTMQQYGFAELTLCRGESAYVFQHKFLGLTFAFVIEGLGTKNLVAENAELRKALGDFFYYNIAQCAAAAAFNDLITVGAMPLVMGMHPAVCEGSHLAGRQGEDLVHGTTDSLIAARCTYGPGETPALPGIIVPGTMCLSASAIGFVRRDGHLMFGADVRAGQRIILLASSGIHANGLSLARKIAEKLPKKYLTDIGNGQTYGEALLTPTKLYVEFIRRCQDREFPIAYAANITGHGWRKLMRAPQSLRYIINVVPAVPAIFHFMAEHGPVAPEEMYATFNMGAGFALYVEPPNVANVLSVAKELDIDAIDAGYVAEGERSVRIEPLDLTYRKLDLR